MATYVLVHGAFQGGWIWKKVATHLRAAGHMVYTPTMEGCAERGIQIRPGITMETHVKELVEFLFFEDLHDVILVGTSASGLTISEVANQTRERIGRLVYIEALLPLPGEKMSDLLTPVPNINAKWETTRLSYGPAREFINGYMFMDLDPETRAWAAERFTLFPITATPQGAAGPTDFWDRPWKATVINCLQSSNPSNAHQRRTAEKLNANLIEMDAGHYPMLSHPKELAELLMQ